MQTLTLKVSIKLAHIKLWRKNVILLIINLFDQQAAARKISIFPTLLYLTLLLHFRFLVRFLMTTSPVNPDPL